MEISSSLALFIAIGTQVISSVSLFWAVTSSFNNRINSVEEKLNNRMTAVETRVTGIEKDIEYIKKDLDRILSYFPTPKLAIQNTQEPC